MFSIRPPFRIRILRRSENNQIRIASNRIGPFLIRSSQFLWSGGKVKPSWKPPCKFSSSTSPSKYAFETSICSMSKAKICGKAEKHPQGIEAKCGCKVFFVVKAILLCKASCNQPGLISIYKAIVGILHLKYPWRGNNVCPLRPSAVLPCTICNESTLLKVPNRMKIRRGRSLLLAPLVGTLRLPSHWLSYLCACLGGVDGLVRGGF